VPSKSRVSFRLVAFVVPVCLLAGTVQAPPAAPKQAVSEVYHGIKVLDDYRWLKDGQSADVRTWVAAENAYSQAYFASVRDRPEIRKKIREYETVSSVRHRKFEYAAGTFFALRMAPDRQQPVLVALTSPDDLASERTVLDPTSINSSGHLSIDWFVPSPDGKVVAVAMSENGSEDSSLYIYDVAACKQIGDIIPRVNFPTAGGSATWLPDNKTILYTRYPELAERPKADEHFYQQIYSHRLGTPVAQDTYELGKGLPRIAEITLVTDTRANHVVASVANGDGGEFEHFVRAGTAQWKQITQFEDGVVGVSISPEGDLFLLSRKDAPRGKILRLSSGKLGLARLVVPESTASMETPQGAVINPWLPLQASFTSRASTAARTRFACSIIRGTRREPCRCRLSPQLTTCSTQGTMKFCSRSERSRLPPLITGTAPRRERNQPQFTTLLQWT
jgi:prolyl oligopeptidase